MPNPGTELASLDFGNLIGGPLVAVITAQSIAARSTADFIKTVGFDSDDKPVYVDFKYPKEIQPYQPAKNRQVISLTITTAGAGYKPNEVVTIIFSAGAGQTAATGTITADVNGNIGTTAISTITSGGDYPGTGTVTAAIASPAAITGTTPVGTVNLSTAVSATNAVYQEMKFSVPILTMLPIPFIKVDMFTMDFNAKITSMETTTTSSEASISGNLEVQQRWPSGSAKLNVSAAYKRSTSTGSSVERTYSMAIHVQASQDEMPAGMEKLLNILEGAMISTPGAVMPH